MTKNTSKFATLRMINHEHDSSKGYRYVVGKNFAIRLDTITEVGALELTEVYPSHEVRMHYEYGQNGCDRTKVFPTQKIAHISTSNAHGLGINGTSYNHTIDEASWNLVCKELGINI